MGSTKNEELKFEWYKFSARFVAEEFKLKYVHPNAEATNKKKCLIGMKNATTWVWYQKNSNLQLKKMNQKNKITKVIKNHFISKGKKNGRKQMLPKMYLKYQKKKKTKKKK